MLSFTAAALHVGIIFGGGNWYRFFGAGERMASAAEAGELFPAIVTAGIAMVLVFWGIYALSAAGDVPRLPLLKVAVILITSVYLLRGVLFAPVFWSSGQYSVPFMLWSSLICLVFGLVHLAGTALVWRSL